MKRARAQALVLVNWKGVFYERYLLDPHVTALEGSNGAGKTTVMIAAYMVLLPDLTRLRFTNLGETAATGGDKGIFGRLGHPDAPSYAAFEFKLGSGERLLAGVCIERRSEPNLELTPFIVTGLPDDVTLQEVLLDRGEIDDSVPDLNRLRELMALAGGRLKTFHKLTEYFAELFDRGVTPLRLTNDEDRAKFNEMLRTSMIGGISRTLTGGLREFLLKEETGLAETLKRMRGNLDACRRTRLEVEAAQKMEREIHEVYETGHEMFVAALHAIREHAEETHARFLRAQAQYEAAEADRSLLADSLTARSAQHEAIKGELAVLQEELGQAQQIAERVRAAHAIFVSLSAKLTERPELVAETERHDAEQARCVATRDRARQNLVEAQQRVKIAADGLADFQAGLEELHWRASGYRYASQRLVEAREGLPEHDVQAQNLTEVRQHVEDQIRMLDAGIVRLDREIATFHQKRSDFARVAAAIGTIAGTVPETTRVFEAALALLNDLRVLDDVASELPSLPTKLNAAREMADSQQTVREAARKLTTSEIRLASSEEVHAAFSVADSHLQSLKERHASEASASAGAAAQRSQSEAEVTDLERLCERWNTVQTAVKAFSLEWEQPIQGRNDLDLLQKRIHSERDHVRDQLRIADEKRRHVAEVAEQLAHSGGLFSEGLLRARDAVEGELMAGLFDDADLAEAGYLEAVLGPLAEAIVVPDPAEAARTLASLPDCPHHVWLVEQESTALSLILQDAEVERLGDSVRVPSPIGMRLSQVPVHPTLGRRAREKHLRTLQSDLEQLDRQRLELAARLRALETAISSASMLVPEAAVLERPDPAPDLAAARSGAAEHAIAEKAHRANADALESEIQKVEVRRQALRDLLPQAQLLDPPDYRDELAALTAQLTEAKSAKAKLENVAAPRKTIQEGLDLVRVLPPRESDIDALRTELASMTRFRDCLSGPLTALRFVEENLQALEWSDAPVALQAKQQLRPALDQQFNRAAEDHARALNETNFADAALEHATKDAQSSQARLIHLDAAIERQRQDLAETGVEDPSEGSLRSVTERYTELMVRYREGDDAERKLGQEVEVAKVRLETQTQKADQLRSARNEEEGQWRPMNERWQRLQAEAEAVGVLRTAMTPAVMERMSAAGSVNLYQKAKTQGSILAERLSRAEGGREKGEALQARLDAPEPDFGLSYLSTWLDIREWLRLRVPPQIAEVDDPLESLKRVGDHLERLRERLEQQEHHLRGQSEDIARNIETQRRKARREISRLNYDLESIRFGSIEGVRIQVYPVESRERVLRALREGEAQQFLFRSEIPIEEAMDELFRSYGGGQNGGHKLLDYREYLDLRVEAKRQGTKDWESANPAKLSTGEAIGVGAAIMMVVLTAWERQANILRPRRSAGTLRLLFLDEANRLSQDSLSVLFELCKNLELQLLIAAPEVAQSEGNTTFHLVRQLDEAGQEIVRVSGRRTLGANA